MFRDDSLARDMPEDLCYVGHVTIDVPTARHCVSRPISDSRDGRRAPSGDVGESWGMT